MEEFLFRDFELLNFMKENEEDDPSTQPNVDGCGDDEHDTADGQDPSISIVDTRIQVDRRRLEAMLAALSIIPPACSVTDGDADSSGEHSSSSPTASTTTTTRDQHAASSSSEACVFFKEVESATGARVSWPSRLKLGAKTKKDPFVKLEGTSLAVAKAKEMIAERLQVRRERVTLKVEIPHAEHSHIIGRGGCNTKGIMQHTQCHIHFPDLLLHNGTSSTNSQGVGLAKDRCPGMNSSAGLHTSFQPHIVVGSVAPAKSAERNPHLVSLSGQVEQVEAARQALRQQAPMVITVALPKQHALKVDGDHLVCNTAPNPPSSRQQLNSFLQRQLAESTPEVTLLPAVAAATSTQQLSQPYEFSLKSSVKHEAQLARALSKLGELVAATGSTKGSNFNPEKVVCKSVLDIRASLLQQSTSHIPTSTTRSSCCSSSIHEQRHPCGGRCQMQQEGMRKPLLAPARDVIRWIESKTNCRIYHRCDGGAESMSGSRRGDPRGYSGYNDIISLTTVGTLRSIFMARRYLTGLMPISLQFEIPATTATATLRTSTSTATRRASISEEEGVKNDEDGKTTGWTALERELDVQIGEKPNRVRGNGGGGKASKATSNTKSNRAQRLLIIRSYEANLCNVYEARRRLLLHEGRASNSEEHGLRQNNLRKGGPEEGSVVDDADEVDETLRAMMKSMRYDARIMAEEDHDPTLMAASPSGERSCFPAALKRTQNAGFRPPPPPAVPCPQPFFTSPWITHPVMHPLSNTFPALPTNMNLPPTHMAAQASSMAAAMVQQGRLFPPYIYPNPLLPLSAATTVVPAMQMLPGGGVTINFQHAQAFHHNIVPFHHHHHSVTVPPPLPQIPNFTPTPLQQASYHHLYQQPAPLLLPPPSRQHSSSPAATSIPANASGNQTTTANTREHQASDAGAIGCQAQQHPQDPSAESVKAADMEKLENVAAISNDTTGSRRAGYAAEPKSPDPNESPIAHALLASAKGLQLQQLLRSQKCEEDRILADQVGGTNHQLPEACTSPPSWSSASSSSPPSPPTSPEPSEKRGNLANKEEASENDTTLGGPLHWANYGFSSSLPSDLLKFGLHSYFDTWKEGGKVEQSIGNKYGRRVNENISIATVITSTGHEIEAKNKARRRGSLGHITTPTALGISSQHPQQSLLKPFHGLRPIVGMGSSTAPSSSSSASASSAAAGLCSSIKVPLPPRFSTSLVCGLGTSGGGGLLASVREEREDELTMSGGSSTTAVVTLANKSQQSLLFGDLLLKAPLPLPAAVGKMSPTPPSPSIIASTSTGLGEVEGGGKRRVDQPLQQRPNYTFSNSAASASQQLLHSTPFTFATNVVGAAAEKKGGGYHSAGQLKSLNKWELKLYTDVADVLRQLDCSEYLPKFREQEIDMHAFLLLDEENLSDIGITTLGARKKIFNAITKLREATGAN